MGFSLSLFFKGILMGVCDLIPGISGGTIAFITGIYERFINAVKGISFPNFKKSYEILISKKKRKFSKICEIFDIGFLSTVLLGIILAILLGSRGINYLLENHFSVLMSFFIGLIIASSYIIYKQIEIHNSKNLFSALIGLLIGVSFLVLSPLIVYSPSSLYIIFGGFVAITALFLPGISGSFILLILGLYEYIIGLLQDIFSNIKEIALFGIGGLFGAVVISRIVSYLFRKDKSKTLYFLVGLVLGSLSVPVLRVIETIEVVNFLPIGTLVFSSLLGVFLVLFIDKSF